MGDLVYINNNHALTTSLLVAEKFGKEHKHVLEAVRCLLTKTENSVFVDNQQITKMFALAEIEQPMPVGGGVKKIPMYVMNRDGFTLLAMGFTGEKALHFKLEYINAFNEMEKNIKETTGLPQTFAEALRLAADQQERIEEQAKQIEEQQKTIQQSAQEIVALNNKVSYTNMVLQCKETVTITQIAQDYGMSAKAFNSLLHDHGIQHKVNGQWILYKKYIPCGYVQSDTIDITHTDGTNGVVMHTKWTQKGRLFIYNTLKQHDVLPLIEQQNKQKAV